jgi:hypothetical protein
MFLHVRVYIMIWNGTIQIEKHNKIANSLIFIFDTTCGQPEEKCYPIRTLRIFGGVQIGIGILSALLSVAGIVLDGITSNNDCDYNQDDWLICLCIFNIFCRLWWILKYKTSKMQLYLNSYISLFDISELSQNTDYVHYKYN